MDLEFDQGPPIPIPYNYTARDYQLPFWEAMVEGKKRAVLVWHRRAGKDKTCWNYMIMKAIQQPGIYYYFFPKFSQGRKILWDGMDKTGFRFLDHVPKEMIEGVPNSTEMKIRLRNGSLLQVIGTDNCDACMGTNPRGCVFSEYSLQNPVAWQLIRPILVENGGWAVFIMTPRGANHAKNLFDMSCVNPDWFSQRLTIDDTKVVTPEQIQAEREAGMSEDFIQQEFYCSFTLGVEGSYYAQYMQDAKDEERIGLVPWNRHTRVFTAWDLGYEDYCSIVFFQISGQQIHVIDYYENCLKGMDHYADVLKKKPYVYDAHYAPHDADNHTFSSGMSTKEVAAGLGITLTVLKTRNLRISDGIEIVRGVFPRVWMDEKKCGQLIKCLENYRKEFDQRLEVYRERPRHDKYSHGADAFRYMAIAMRSCLDSGRLGIDDEQSEIWYQKYNPLFR